jgi:hypothetical protein
LSYSFSALNPTSLSSFGDSQRTRSDMLLSAQGQGVVVVLPRYPALRLGRLFATFLKLLWTPAARGSLALKFRGQAPSVAVVADSGMVVWSAWSRPRPRHKKHQLPRDGRDLDHPLRFWDNSTVSVSVAVANRSLLPPFFRLAPRAGAMPTYGIACSVQTSRRN